MRILIVISIIISTSFLLLSCVQNQYSYQDRFAVQAANNRANSYNIANNALSSIAKAPILSKNWQKIVKNSVASVLKDPDSAKYKFQGSPVLCSFSNTGRSFKGTLNNYVSPLVGYAGLVWVNAKNSYGGYVGDTPYFYIISNGEVAVLWSNSSGLWNELSDVQHHLENSYSESLLIK